MGLVAARWGWRLPRFCAVSHYAKISYKICPFHSMPKMRRLVRPRCKWRLLRAESEIWRNSKNRSMQQVWRADFNRYRIDEISSHTPGAHPTFCEAWEQPDLRDSDRKSTRLNSSHPSISYA